MKRKFGLERMFLGRYKASNKSLYAVEGGDAKKMARTVNGQMSLGDIHPYASEGDRSGCGSDAAIYYCGSELNDYEDEGWYKPVTYAANRN